MVADFERFRRIVKLVCFREVLVRELLRESGLKSHSSRRSIRSGQRHSVTEAESELEKNESDPFESAREEAGGNGDVSLPASEERLSASVTSLSAREC